MKLPRRTALVEFAPEHEYAGVEVRLHLDAPMSLLFAFQRSSAADSDSEATLRRFAEEILVGWNLEDDDGEPIPATPEGFLAQPFSFASALLQNWMEATTQPAAPLEVRSSVGLGLGALSVATGT